MDEHYSDAHLRDILKRTKNIAVVGVSPNPQRPRYFVARYLGLKGFNVIPVNPGHAGKELFGSTIRASLSEIEELTTETLHLMVNGPCYDISGSQLTAGVEFVHKPLPIGKL